MVVVSSSISELTNKAIEYIAQQVGQSKSAVIENLIEESLPLYEEKVRQRKKLVPK